MEIGNIVSNGQNPAGFGGMGQTELQKADFLKLLIAQVSNQDPMSPLENQDFAAQLAQFSSLEQLSSIDGNLRQGIEMDLILTQAINNTLASTVIGKDIIAVGNTVNLNSDDTAEISFRLSQFADDVEVTVTNSAGNVVRTLTAKSLGKGDQTLEWDGKNEQGETVSDDTYHFSVNATSANGDSVSAMPLTRGTVTAVRYDNGMAVLVIGEEEVSFSSVLEIGLFDEES